MCYMMTAQIPFILDFLVADLTLHLSSDRVHVQYMLNNNIINTELNLQ